MRLDAIFGEQYSIRRVISIAILIGWCTTACGEPEDLPEDDMAMEDEVPADEVPADNVDTPPEVPMPRGCGELTAVIRDFKAEHPDMEGSFTRLTGIVEAELGPDDKPVYAHDGPTVATSGKDEFDQWYRDVAGVNLPFEISIVLAEDESGRFNFDGDAFFPLDGRGFAGEEVLGHNYHFTTEIHGSFEYNGGETFSFVGDDDVWVFINRKLALDLGGLHAPLSGDIDLDAQAQELGLVPGEIYQLDMFHAERHTTQSNFHIDTSIDCLVVK